MGWFFWDIEQTIYFNMEYYVGKLSDLFRWVLGADAVVG